MIDLAGQPERGERPIDDVQHDDHEARLARLANEVDLLEQREGVGQEPARQIDHVVARRVAEHGIDHRHLPVGAREIHEPRALGQVGANAAERAFGVEDGGLAADQRQVIGDEARQKRLAVARLIGAHDVNFRRHAHIPACLGPAIGAGPCGSWTTRRRPPPAGERASTGSGSATTARSGHRGPGTSAAHSRAARRNSCPAGRRRPGFR